jgi:hypothetical protein
MMRDYQETGAAGIPSGFGSMQGAGGAESAAPSDGATADYLD